MRRRLQQEPAHLLRALVAKAGEDDEPLTPAEERACGEGWQAYLRGEGRTLAEVRRDLARK